jgi:GTPase Era involved in 16S rRNA processing
VSEIPTFAVVGHPNKGKSSIVSTLAHDDSVRIAPEPGTTRVCRRYPMKLDGRVQYVLVDTPGFQRARTALAWMRERETRADLHRAVVEAFVAAERGSGRFDDEVELLTPVLEGAGILYVVDGSVPYGPEYEPEMEILRWTGEPSLALINPIGRADHIASWQAALSQYFKIVRVFDALTAPFEKRLELLQAFGALRESWRAPLEEAVRALMQERVQVRERVARLIAALLVDALTLSVSKQLPEGAEPRSYEAALEGEYHEALREREREARRQVEEAYGHREIQRREETFSSIADQDLFSVEHWVLWGLRRRQLVATGAAGGALVGGALDAAVGGASLMLGALFGAAAGGAAALWSSFRLATARIQGLPLGGRELRCGPTRNRNFPWVLLGRALHHNARLAGRTHADRGALELEAAGGPSWAERIEPSRRSALERIFGRLRDGDTDPELAQDLALLLGPIVAQADVAPGVAKKT